MTKFIRDSVKFEKLKSDGQRRISRLRFLKNMAGNSGNGTTGGLHSK